MRGTAERARTRPPAAASRGRRGSCVCVSSPSAVLGKPPALRPPVRAGNAPQCAEKRAGPGRVSGAAGGTGGCGAGGAQRGPGAARPAGELLCGPFSHRPAEPGRGVQPGPSGRAEK